MHIDLLIPLEGEKKQMLSQYLHKNLMYITNTFQSITNTIKGDI